MAAKKRPQTPIDAPEILSEDVPEALLDLVTQVLPLVETARLQVWRGGGWTQSRRILRTEAGSMGVDELCVQILGLARAYVGECERRGEAVPEKYRVRLDCRQGEHVSPRFAVFRLGLAPDGTATWISGTSGDEEGDAIRRSLGAVSESVAIALDCLRGVRESIAALAAIGKNQAEAIAATSQLVAQSGQRTEGLERLRVELLQAEQEHEIRLRRMDTVEPLLREAASPLIAEMEEVIRKKRPRNPLCRRLAHLWEDTAQHVDVLEDAIGAEGSDVLERARAATTDEELRAHVAELLRIVDVERVAQAMSSVPLHLQARWGRFLRDAAPRAANTGTG